MDRLGRAGLTVAVTGLTGTFGFGLVPVLEADDRIGRVIGIARRPFDPTAQVSAACRGAGLVARP